MSARHDPEHDLERLLEADGGDFGPLYRRLSQAEPPRRLDRSVLAEAARAVHGNRPPRSQRWLLGFGSAAGLVLAAGVAWQVGKQMQSDEAARTDAGRPSEIISVQPLDAPARKETPKADEAAAVAAAPAPATAAMPAPEREQETARKRSPAPPPKPAKAIPAPAPPPAPAAPAAAVMAEPDVRDSAELAEPQATRQAAPRAFADEGVAASAEEANAAGALSGAATKSAPAIGSSAPAPRSSVRLRRNMQLAPADWLAEIERLVSRGERQEAIENLRLFRRMHPDWQVSPSLQQLDE